MLLARVPLATGVVAVAAEETALGPLRVDLGLARGEAVAVGDDVGDAAALVFLLDVVPVVALLVCYSSFGAIRAPSLL